MRPLTGFEDRAPHRGAFLLHRLLSGPSPHGASPKPMKAGALQVRTGIPHCIRRIVIGCQARARVGEATAPQAPCTTGRCPEMAALPGSCWFATAISTTAPARPMSAAKRYILGFRFMSRSPRTLLHRNARLECPVACTLADLCCRPVSCRSGRGNSCYESSERRIQRGNLLCARGGLRYRSRRERLAPTPKAGGAVGGTDPWHEPCSISNGAAASASTRGR